MDNHTKVTSNDSVNGRKKRRLDVQGPTQSSNNARGSRKRVGKLAELPNMPIDILFEV